MDTNSSTNWKMQDFRSFSVEQIGQSLVVDSSFVVNTNQKQLEHADMSSSLYEIMMHLIGDAVILIEANGNVKTINPVAECLTGWKAKEAKSKPIAQVFRIVRESDDCNSNPIDEVLACGEATESFSPVLLVSKEGKHFTIEYSATPLYGQADQLVGAVLIFRDVSEPQKLARQLSWQSSHDSLTGLLNRRAFEQFLEQAVSDASNLNQQHVLCYLDIDRFAIVNDTQGHEAGDELLCQIGAILLNRVRHTDILARLGGDEFGLLLCHCSLESASEIMSTLQEAIQDQKFIWKEEAFSFSFSAGLVDINDNIDNFSSVLSYANAACQIAKNNGRNRVHIYQADDLQLASQRDKMHWAIRIPRALENNRFQLYIQPIVPVTDAHQEIGNCVKHYEVLIRLEDETGEIISPGEFIPAAESYGLMSSIDRWVVESVFEYLHYNIDTKKQKNFLESEHEIYTINLSGNSLNDDGFIHFIQEEFQSFNVLPEMICFEITETVAISNLNKVSQFISRLKEIGCFFALDDFGSGMSSFGYLKNLPVDFLKIDGSFVRDIACSREAYEIVGAINRVGHVMGMKTIAECVESKEILTKLECLDVDYAQGYVFSKPYPLTSFALSQEISQRQGQKLGLSHKQQQLWSDYRRSKQAPTVNCFRTFRLDFNFNVEALNRAWQQVLNRHPILRTTYFESEGKPVQIVADREKAYIQMIDAADWSWNNLHTQILQDACSPFNLERGPVYRLNMFLTAERDYILLLSIHSIAIDNSSLDILFRELEALYTCECQQEVLELEDSVPYSSFVHRERETLGSPQGEASEQFWQQQLCQTFPILELPTDRPSGASSQPQTALHSVELEEPISAELRSLAAKRDSSLFALFMTIVQVQLYRYTGQCDIALGTTVSLRSSDYENSLGNFETAAILRADLSNQPTFSFLLEQTTSNLSRSLEYSVYPIENLLDRLQSTDAKQLPCQVALSWKTARTDKEITTHWSPYSLPEDIDRSKFELDIRVSELESTLQIDWYYDAELFESATIERLASHFLALIGSVCSDPNQTVDELQLLPPREQHQLLVEWQNTGTEFPHQACIHHLFEAQVVRTPDKIAVECGQELITYQNLNNRANQLASFLQQLGVGPDVLVGVCLERSIEMLVAILGVLKSGGAYIPIDPTYPKERIAYLIQDSCIPVLLTATHLLPGLPPTEGIQLVCLDAEADRLSQQPTVNVARPVASTHLAYAIYTSGSTGNPKGVTIEHSALVNFAHAAIQTYDICSNDRVLQFSSPSFDAAIEEIYPCLCTGGTLVFRTDEMLLSVAVFLKHCCDWGITVLDLPTAYWHQLTFELGTNSSLQVPPSVRMVIVGGEAASPERLRVWQQVARNIPAINTYGPTESTVVATTYALPESEKIGVTSPLFRRGLSSEHNRFSTVPIGRPLPNVRTYVLDRHLQPQPIGVPGELYVGGRGIARGYLNRPEMNESRFLPDPFSGLPQARLYKTGDLARYLPDGNLEFLGRIDQQVKIRGFRIELGEVEAAISTHPDVSEVVVVAQDDAAGNKSLLAYIVSRLLPDRLPFVSDCLLECNGAVTQLQTVDVSLLGISVEGAISQLSTGDFGRIKLAAFNSVSSCEWMEVKVAWSKDRRAGLQLQLRPKEKTDWSDWIDRIMTSQGSIKTLQRTINRNLRNYLKNKLPDYMVPSSFMLLATLPMTPNGKVDRNQLPFKKLDTLTITHSDCELPRTLTEEILTRIWVDLLGTDVGIHDDFFDLGGHSLLMTQLTFRVQEKFSVSLPLRALTETPTVSAIATAIDRVKLGQEFPKSPVKALDLQKETHLDLTIELHSLAKTQTFLLTGSTGFLGSHLLADLLSKTAANVYCLVRADSCEEGQHRIRLALSNYSLWEESYASRIQPVLGDLSKPLLGINEVEYNYLALRLDSIYHCGALVNFVYPYDRLKGPNVRGTEEVLRLAAQEKVKPLHYISTLSVFDALDYYDGRKIYEDDKLQFSNSFFTGYAQSKWVAEKLVLKARDRGFPVSIYRPSEIFSSSRTGLSNVDDYISRMIKGCIQLQMWPALDIHWQLMPVDCASNAIVGISQSQTKAGTVFHIASPHCIHIDEIFGMVQNLGYPLQKIEYDCWKSMLTEFVQRSEDVALASLLPMFTDSATPNTDLSIQQLHVLGKAPEYDCTNSQAALENTDFSCPPIKANSLKLVIDGFIERGFLERPASIRPELIRSRC